MSRFWNYRSWDNSFNKNVVNHIDFTLKHAWKNRSVGSEPMDWAYKRLAGLAQSIDKWRDLDRYVMESNVDHPALDKWLPDRPVVTYRELMTAADKALDWASAKFMVQHLALIKQSGNIHQLKRWEDFMNKRGLADLVAKDEWVEGSKYKGSGFANIIDNKHVTVGQLFENAKDSAEDKIESKKLQLKAAAERFQELSGILWAGTITGNSQELIRAMADHATKIDEFLGDFVPGNNKHGMLDTYQEVANLASWLNARGQSHYTKQWQQIVEGTFNRFIDQQIAFFNENKEKYKNVQSNENTNEILLLLNIIFSAVAGIGSIGFGISNFRAITNQQGGGVGFFATANFPAFLGSGTLLINNTVQSISAFMRSEFGISERLHLSQNALEKLEAFDTAFKDFRDYVFPELYKQAHREHSGRDGWDREHVDTWNYGWQNVPHSRRGELLERIATFEEVKERGINLENYSLFFWTIESIRYTTRGLPVFNQILVGIKNTEYKDHVSKLKELIDQNNKKKGTQSIDAEVENVVGTAGDDYLVPEGEGAVSISGLAGDDMIVGSADADTLLGGDGDDVIVGGSGSDSIDGGAGNDFVSFEDAEEGVSVIVGTHHGEATIGPDVDTLSGDAGNDSLFGGDHADSLDGGVGNDLLEGGTGNDTLSGDAGNDSLFGGNHTDSLDGGVGNDLLEGGAANDTLNGGAENDSLFGGDGNDFLEGGVGSDTLHGGAGNDTIVGDQNGVHDAADAADELHGGAGRDIFVFNVSASGRRSSDVVVDFELGVDKINILRSGNDGVRKTDFDLTFKDQMLSIDWNKDGVADFVVNIRNISSIGKNDVNLF